MKALIAAAALAASAVGGLSFAPITVQAQPHDRFWHGPPHGPRWQAWRQHYRGRWRREPIRVCRHRRCWYR